MASLVLKISLASSKSHSSSLHSRSNDGGFISSMKLLALLERRSMCAFGLLENADQNIQRVDKAEQHTVGFQIGFKPIAYYKNLRDNTSRKNCVF